VGEPTAEDARKKRDGSKNAVARKPRWGKGREGLRGNGGPKNRGKKNPTHYPFTRISKKKNGTHTM